MGGVRGRWSLCEGDVLYRAWVLGSFGAWLNE